MAENVALTIAIRPLLLEKGVFSSSEAHHGAKRGARETKGPLLDSKRRLLECESAAIDSNRRVIEQKTQSTSKMTGSRFIGRGFRFQSRRSRRKSAASDPNRAAFDEKARFAILEGPLSRRVREPVRPRRGFLRRVAGGIHPSVPRVVFTTAMQRHTGCPEDTVDGRTVRAALDAYFARHASARAYVLDEQGELRHHVVVFVDGVQVRDRAALGEHVAAGGEIYVMQALSGG